MSRKLLTGADFNNQKATRVAAGVDPTDGVNYGQLLDAMRGFDLKDPVRVVSTTNLTLSGTQTVDGVALAVGDRVLVAGQTEAKTNGIWVAAAGAWTRATDADVDVEITPGFTVAVLQGNQKGTGTTQGNIVRYTITLAPGTAVTVGTTALAFAPEGSSSSSAPTSGSGAISVSGTAVSFVPKSGGGLAQDASGAYLDPNGSLVAKRYAGAVPSGSASATITHGLGTRDVIVKVYDTSADPWIEVDVDVAIPTGGNTVTLTFASAPTTGQYRTVIIA